MEKERKLRDIIIEGLKDSQNWLFWFCFFWTSIHIVMMWGEFLSPLLGWQFKTPEGMTSVYVSLLTVYTANKEIGKWIGKKITIQRPGELLIYAWWLSMLAMFCWLYLNGNSLKMPKEMTNISLWVLGIFMSSELSKTIRNKINPGK